MTHSDSSHSHAKTSNGTHVHNAHNVLHYLCDGHSDKTETLFLPLFNEALWPVYLRRFLYFIAILFVFVGISIAVDVFMGAIDKITTHTIKIKNKNAAPGEPEYREVSIWNETVATLTLGAAGTCSPEICLTIVEVVSKFQQQSLLEYVT